MTLLGDICIIQRTRGCILHTSSGSHQLTRLLYVVRRGQRSASSVESQCPRFSLSLSPSLSVYVDSFCYFARSKRHVYLNCRERSYCGRFILRYRSEHIIIKAARRLSAGLYVLPLSFWHPNYNLSRGPELPYYKYTRGLTVWSQAELVKFTDTFRLPVP